MKKVILCGLGAVGLTFAVKLKEVVDLKILADELRIKRFLAKKPVFNGEEQDFIYITPQNQKETADLIIISTKFDGLNSAMSYIKNFVSENTRIISLINGISSEEIISSAYPNAKTLKSYFIGHSAVRDGNFVTQDGNGEIVFEGDKIVETIFKSAKINYSIPNDINYSMWLKFALNSFSNPTSAILGMTFGELKSNTVFLDFAKKIISEVKKIAEKKGVLGLENLERDALKKLEGMCNDGKTSMLQDVLAHRKTEIDIFSGEIIRLGRLYNISTPYSQVLYDLIKIQEEKYEHSIHTC